MSIMTAISGLLINNDYMDVISNNIANASTIGYKSSKPVFFDMFSHSVYSNNTKGFGVGVSNIIQNFNNGAFIETGRDLDLRILENGFFRIIDSHGNVYYTRNGQFLLDKNKNIINMQGMYLTGYNIPNTKNNINNLSDLEPINLKKADLFKAQPTSKIKLTVVLNNNDFVSNEDTSNNDLSKLAERKTYIKIYNQDAQEEQLNISFNKTDNEKEWIVKVESNEGSTEKNIDNSFSLKFNNDGELISDPICHIKSKDLKYKNVILDLTNTIQKSNINSSIEASFQDGCPQGTLKTFNILPNGEIIGIYSNEQKAVIGQILLSNFINPEKLQSESGNLWSVTEESGAENIGKAGDIGFGILNEKTLEASNVDLNQELINMIIAQRNYQSNAQSFKTEDKIINTLINLR